MEQIVELIEYIFTHLTLSGQAAALVNVAILMIVARFLRSERELQVYLREMKLRISKNDRITAREALKILLVCCALSGAAVMLVN